MSPAAHHRLKRLAARENRTMGQVVERLVDQQTAYEANPWTENAGLLLQQEPLAGPWGDPDLDVYGDDDAAPR
ncbi:MAG: hypothetical protein HY608_11165 [Planctomycetes bacterium]|nr:hypothetical protein [Planctomycetota bacterium]